MKEIDKSIEVSILLDTYGKLLTIKQYMVLDDYYNNDLSLSEIAENEGITRQAVRDNLKKGENNLFEFEESLGIIKEKGKRKQDIDKILNYIDLLKNCDKDIDELKEMIKDLI